MSEILPVTNAVPPRTGARASRTQKTLPVEAKSVIWNPSPQEFRQYAEDMPNARRTEFGNINVATRVVSRSKLSTFVVSDRKEEHSDQTITRAQYERMARLQNDYIR